MARTQVPKFGDWESEEVPYTICFDNATKTRKSGPIYQNENFKAESKSHNLSEAKSPINLRRSTDSPLHAKSPGGNRRMHERQRSREEGEMRKLTDSPMRHENGGRKNYSESPQHHHGTFSAGDTPRRASRQSLGPDRSVDHSPMHPHSQARNGPKSSPSYERKATFDGTHSMAPSTPGRSRLRSVTRGDETPEHGPAIPKFGEWDETDPATAEGYSIIFNKVREEKHSETGKVPVMPTEVAYSNGHKQYHVDEVKGCGCFSWGRR